PPRPTAQAVACLDWRPYALTRSGPDLTAPLAWSGGFPMAHVTAEPRSACAALPGPIRKALGRLDRRLRGLAALRGVGTAAVVAALGAAAGMTADFVWGLRAEARWGVWVAWVVAVAWPLGAALGRMVGRRARALEL